MKMQILTQQVWCGPQSLPLTSSQVMLIRPGPGEHTLNSKAEGDPVSLEDGPSPYPELVLLSLGLESVGTTHRAPGSPNPGDYFCCNRESQLGTCLPSVLTGLGRLD